MNSGILIRTTPQAVPQKTKTHQSASPICFSPCPLQSMPGGHTLLPSESSTPGHLCFESPLLLEVCSISQTSLAQSVVRVAKTRALCTSIHRKEILDVEQPTHYKIRLPQVHTERVYHSESGTSTWVRILCSSLRPISRIPKPHVSVSSPKCPARLCATLESFKQS